jgi:hypothetical protein
VYNHADHVFWIGAGICDLLINGRNCGARLAAERRGIPTGRQAFLPIPLSNDLRQHIPDRDLARKRLDVDADTVLLLSAASAYKYRPDGEADFAEMHAQVLQRNKNARLIVVGPSSDAPYWSNWESVTDGRIRAVGHHPNIFEFLAAADIYCDSFPMGSSTSLLEAGSAGIPCVSWRPYDPESYSTVLSTDDFSFDGFDVETNDKSLYSKRLHNLINSPHRHELGDQFRLAVERVHTSVGWQAAVDATYQRLDEAAAGRPHEPLSPQGETELFDRILASFHGGRTPSIIQTLRSAPPGLRWECLKITNTSPVELLMSVSPRAAASRTKNAIKARLHQT